MFFRLILYGWDSTGIYSLIVYVHVYTLVWYAYIYTVFNLLVALICLLFVYKLIVQGRGLELLNFVAHTYRSTNLYDLNLEISLGRRRYSLRAAFNFIFYSRKHPVPVNCAASYLHLLLAKASGMLALLI